MNAIEILVIVLCVLVVAAVVAGAIINKKRGKSGCCSECDSCSSRHSCSSAAHGAQNTERRKTHSDTAKEPGHNAKVLTSAVTDEGQSDCRHGSCGCCCGHCAHGEKRDSAGCEGSSPHTANKT